MTPMGGRAVPPPPPEAVPKPMPPPAAQAAENVVPTQTRPHAAGEAEGRRRAAGPGVTRTETGARGQGFGSVSRRRRRQRRAARRRQLLLPGIPRADGDADPAQLAAEPGRARDDGDEVHDHARRLDSGRAWSSGRAGSSRSIWPRSARCCTTRLPGAAAAVSQSDADRSHDIRVSAMNMRNSNSRDANSQASPAT